MCGIAGLIHRGKTSDIGAEMTAMLQSLRHRGPDSTGFALYGGSGGGANGKAKENHYVMRFKVAEQEDMSKGFEIHDQVIERREVVDRRLEKLGAKLIAKDQATEYAHRYTFAYDGDMRSLADQVEAAPHAEILSIGPRPGTHQGHGRRQHRVRAIPTVRLHRHPRHRPHAHGNRIRR